MDMVILTQSACIHFSFGRHEEIIEGYDTSEITAEITVFSQHANHSPPVYHHPRLIEALKITETLYRKSLPCHIPQFSFEYEKIHIFTQVHSHFTGSE